MGGEGEVEWECKEKPPPLQLHLEEKRRLVGGGMYEGHKAPLTPTNSEKELCCGRVVATSRVVVKEKQ